MIIDKIKNWRIYFDRNSRFANGFEFLETTDLLYLPEGRHDIDGDNLFALVSNYTTKPPEEKDPESHRVYADIQYIVSGEEKIGYAVLDNQPVCKEYIEEKDIMFYKDYSCFINLFCGMFAVFFPQDIHMPGITINEPVEVKKIVIKVRL